MHIGVLGGTFDPIHVGHCQLAWEALQHYAFSEVRFIPNAQPPHRAAPSASSEARAQMVELAIACEPAFECDRTEIQRKGPSYMVDTLAELRTKYPSAAITLILGIDAFAHFSKWHRYDEILSLAHIVICHRPGTVDPGEVEKALIHAHQKPQNRQLDAQPAGFIDLFSPFALLDIASTDLRALIGEKKVPHFILPKDVCDYIISKGLYGFKGEN